jgi:hypothetical protein
LPEQEVSALLSQARFGVSAQDELSVTKSGTFMAYAAHGMNILSPFANAANTEPLCWTTDPAELARGIPDDELRERAESLRTGRNARARGRELRNSSHARCGSMFNLP